MPKTSVRYSTAASDLIVSGLEMYRLTFRDRLRQPPFIAFAFSISAPQGIPTSVMDLFRSNRGAVVGNHRSVCDWALAGLWLVPIGSKGRACAAKGEKRRDFDHFECSVVDMEQDNKRSVWRN